MYPFLFGEAQEPLYGVYQEGAPGVGGNAAALLCYPLGQEYMRSHFAFRRLSALLAKKGLHNMRFDYFGTGDSAGDAVSMNMTSCLASVDSGVNELQEMSGTSRISLIGLRFGGLVATKYCTHDRMIDSLILWDPVVDGKKYISDLRMLHIIMKTHPAFWVPEGPRHSSPVEGTEELIGFSFSSRFIKEIEDIKLTQRTEFCSRKIYMYVSYQSPEFDELRLHLQSMGVLAGFQFVPDAGDWMAPSEIDQALIPTKLISTIVNDSLDGLEKGGKS